MSTSEDLRLIALSLEGTTEVPHFDRTAFRVRRIYVTLAADGKTANFMFTPEEQAITAGSKPAPRQFQSTSPSRRSGTIGRS